MILILFNTYRDAMDGFDIFMERLNYAEPFSVVFVDEYANMVRTDSDLTYIFIDRRYVPIYNYFKPDLIEGYEFLGELDENYIY